MGAAALLDVDGTLVDSNYHHALAWYRAFREHDLSPGRSGGSTATSASAAISSSPRSPATRSSGALGDAIRESESRLYGELIGEVRPFEGARELIAELRDRGHAVVLASSAKAEDTEHYIELLDARELLEAYTTSADVEATKPEPDLVASAMRKAGELSAVMVGDSTWDVEAAARADVKTIAVLTGGSPRPSCARRARSTCSSRWSTCAQVSTRLRCASRTLDA